MNKRFTYPLFGIVFLAVIFVTGCRKLDKLDDMKAVNYDAEFAIPLFTAKASFQDVLENFDSTTSIYFDENDIIHLKYTGDVAAETSTDIFNVINAANGVPIPLLDTVTSLSFNLPNSIDVDFAILKTGTLQWGYNSEHDEDIIVRFWVPNAIKDGVPFEVIRPLPPNGFFYQQPAVDLSGYKLISENDSISIHYEAYRVDSGYTDTLANFFIILDDFFASYVEGYLGNDIYEFDRDTIEIDVFDNWTRGDVFFYDPLITLRVDNSFGFPVRSQTNLMKILTVDGDSLSLTSDFITNGIDFAYPSLDEVGEVKTTFFDFNKDNSNIDVVLGAGPVAVDYDIDAVPNPDMDTSVRGFMTDTSAFIVQVEVDLPIHGSASGFEARDTFEINFEEFNKVDDVEFKVISENGIPLDVGLQIYFADENGTVLDSLFTPTQNLLDAAPVDSEGLPTGITDKTIFTNFDANRFEDIKTAKYLYLSVSFSTANNGETIVKILSSQEVDIRMGMKIGVSK